MNGLAWSMAAIVAVGVVLRCLYQGLWKEQRVHWVWTLVAFTPLALVGLWAFWAHQFFELLWLADLRHSENYWTNFKAKFWLACAAGSLTLLAGALLRWMTAPWENYENPLASQSDGASDDDYFAERTQKDVRIFGVIVRSVRWVVTIIGTAAAASIATLASPSALLWWNSSPIGQSEPFFGYDLSYFLFELDFRLLCRNFALVLALALCGLQYLAILAHGGIFSESRERSGRRALKVNQRLCVGLLCLLVVALFSIPVTRHAEVFDQSDRIAGISWIDSAVYLPAAWFIGAALLVAIARMIRKLKRERLGVFECLFTALGLPVCSIVLVYGVIAPIATHTVLKGSQFEREKENIERHLAATRKAFGLDAFKVEHADPREVSELSLAELKAAAPATLSNLRLWDPSALAPTISETQSGKAYYRFPDTDLVRYFESGHPRQYVVSTRELDTSRLPVEAHSWLNDHVLYTHGYGVVAAQASEASAEGNPVFRLKDIPVQSTIPGLNVTRPQIYFGEYTANHVYVQEDKPVEFDHPTDDGPGYAKSAHQGSAGIRVGSGLRRLALAWELDGFRTWGSSSISAQSRILSRRRVRERIEGIAPFLYTDEDPYKVIRPDGTMVYVVDAYTGTEMFPHSKAPKGSPRGWNYLKNSVKVVVDAYEGTVDFYEVESDPILEAWKRIYPNLIKPLSAMPQDLVEQLRYPEELFFLQAGLYGSYHMEPEGWFQQLDRWEVAIDAIKKGENGAPRLMSPYYVVGQLPGELSEEFLLFVQLTPAGRNNSAAWMVARNDGEHRNEVRVYRYPSQHQVMGPALIRGRIEQDPQLSAYLTFWRQRGSTVVNGNLLSLPIGETMLYVEPIYIKAEANPTPQLKIVVAAIGDKVGWGETFDKALEKLFDAGSKSSVPELPGGAEQVLKTLGNGDSRLEQARDHFNRYLELTGRGDFEGAAAEIKKLNAVLNGN